MEIRKEKYDTYYSEEARILGRCYNVIKDDKIYHYEFQTNKNKATILCDSLGYIEEVVEEFYNNNLNIYEYTTPDGSFYKSYDPVFTFKLPLSILQPTQVFLNQERLKQLKAFVDIENLFIPVQIIDDEYIVLGKHHLLYLAMQEEYKMVEVYIQNATNKQKELLYLAKEQNIKRMEDMHIIPQDEYELICKQLKELFNLIS